jgi:hypothetical protein
MQPLHTSSFSSVHLQVWRTFAAERLLPRSMTPQPRVFGFHLFNSIEQLRVIKCCVEIVSILKLLFAI